MNNHNYFHKRTSGRSLLGRVLPNLNSGVNRDWDQPGIGP